MDDAVVCPRCDKSDKVECVPVIVAEAFPTLQTAEYVLPRRWAGRIWFTPSPDLTATQYALGTPIRLLPATPDLSQPPRRGSRRTATVYTKEMGINDIDKAIFRAWLVFAAAVLAVIIFLVLGLSVLAVVLTVVATLLLVPLGLMYGLRWLMRKVPQETMPLSADYKREHRREAEARWERLYYCYRDEGVWERGGVFVPLADMEKYLYTGAA